MPINIFHRRQCVAQSLSEKAQQTVAQLAEALGISKSRAQRHRQALQSQQADAVNAFWSSSRWHLPRPTTLQSILSFLT